MRVSKPMIYLIFLPLYDGLTQHVNEYLPAKTGWYPRVSPNRYSPIFKLYVHYDESSFQI